ncbi:hypothetical protein ACHWUR_29395 [Klebsiella pneumoniae]
MPMSLEPTVSPGRARSADPRADPGVPPGVRPGDLFLAGAGRAPGWSLRTSPMPWPRRGCRGLRGRKAPERLPPSDAPLIAVGAGRATVAVAGRFYGEAEPRG